MDIAELVIGGIAKLVDVFATWASAKTEEERARIFARTKELVDKLDGVYDLADNADASKTNAAKDAIK